MFEVLRPPDAHNFIKVRHDALAQLKLTNRFASRPFPPTQHGSIFKGGASEGGLG
jgi:hypothetical protein